MKLTILGSGTSQGVPVIGCRCEVCTSTDSRDKRLRTSAMIETDGGARFVIDAGPDFRCQMLRAGVSRLDAILLTHEHKDHTGGIDDVRAFNFVDYPPVIHPVDIYAAPAAARVVRKALPNASYIGFTGTPISTDDRNTREIFGDYIDVYDMTQSVEDESTKPVYYESRVVSLHLDENALGRIDAVYKEFAHKADQASVEKSKQDLGALDPNFDTP